MKLDALQGAEKYTKVHQRRKRWYQVVTGLACVVVFCTVYALILPAITLEKGACEIPEHTHSEACYTQVTSATRTEPVCTIESLNLHQHDDTCYDSEGNLTCGYADFVVHQHDSACYDEDGNLWCPLPEIESHRHTKSCYDVPDTDEPEVHTHTDDCYTVERGELICTESTEPTHEHTDDCYTETSDLVCEEDHEHTESCYETTRELTCGDTEEPAHRHTDQCYEQIKTLICDLPTEPVEEEEPAEEAEPVLVCEKPEVILHTHQPYESPETPGCYDDGGNLICGKIQVLEHQHTDTCFETVEEPVDTEALTCTLPEDENHTHGPLCHGTWELTCGLDEHQHSEACTPTEPVYICGKEAHTHSETCYDEAGELTCGLEEHTHSEACQPAELTEEEQAQVDEVIALIDALPTAEELDAKLAELTATGNDEDYKAHYASVYEQVIQAHLSYENLSDAQKAKVTNIEKLMAFSYMWDSESIDLDADIETGDFDTVISRLAYMYEKKEKLVTDYNDCTVMYNRMMKAYSACFENDVLMVTAEQIHQVDDLFDEIECYMYETFDYMFAQISYGTATQPLVYNTFGALRTRAVSSAEEGSTGEICVDKYVEQQEDTNGYLLTLSAYVTGNTVTTTIEKPADVVLVLDQSASMHVPVGYPDSVLSYDQLYTGESEGLIRFELNALKENSEMQANAQHLWYYLAQSRIQTADGKYMLYAIQYVPEEARPWKFYPRADTNSNIHDSPLGQPLTFASLDEIGENQFYFYKTQYATLYDSVWSFIGRMRASGVAHRVAIVGFAHPDNSHIYINGTPYRYKSSGNKIYAAALQNVSTSDGFASVTNSLNAYRADYEWTCTSAGLDMAQLVFENAPEVGSDTPDVGRSKVVVLFTDGVSNTTKDGELRNPSRAQNEAVEIAARLKSNYQATVYALGTAAVDWLSYMNYLSSDYPDAQNLSNPGEQIDSPVYTMTAKNANQLNNAFDSVNVSSSETVDLGADTVLRDVISDYFDLPSNITTENINVFTADYLGNGAFAGKENWKPFADAQISFAESMQDVRKDTINVTGFDYAANFVGLNDEGNPRGKKLILEIPIVVRNGFWGGNNVPTNETGTAIYKDDNMMKPFPMPEANVPINPSIEVHDKTIYYGSQVTSKELVTEITAGGAQVEINDDGTLTPQGDWMDDYATLTWTAGSTTAKSPIDNTNCAQYTYSVDQKPKYDGSANQSQNLSNIVGTPVTVAGVTVSDTSQIHVLVPVLTYRDSEIHLGDTPDADYFEETNHVPGVTWVDIEDYATVRQADEEEPTLYFSYQPSGDFLTSAVPVDVTVTRDIPDGKLDMTDVTRFLWNLCSIDLHDKELHDIESPHLGKTIHPEFWIHVRSGYELPNTGGAGTVPYTMGGVLLLTGAVFLLLYNHTKRRKEDSASS